MSALLLWLSLLALPQRAARTESAAAANRFRISGIVVDAASGAPIPGAGVSTFGNGDSVVTVAGDDGKFDLEGMQPGKYGIQAVAHNYVRSAWNQHEPFSTGVAVGPGMDSEHVVLRLRPQAVIAGTITDERGEAVRSARVSLFAKEITNGKPGTIQLTQTETNDLGKYRFAHLAEGTYFLAVVARPWYAGGSILRFAGAGLSGVPITADPAVDVVYGVTFYPGTTDPRGAGEIPVRAGDTAEADVSLQAVPAVHMRLNHVTGSVGRATVQIPSIGGAVEAITMSCVPSPDGECELSGIPPGPVSVEIGFAAAGAAGSRTIRVDASEGVVLEAETPTGGVAVRGRVAWVGGSGNGPVGVVLTDAETQTTRHAVTKADGTFEVPATGAGNYQVKLADGQGGYVIRLEATGAKVKGDTIALQEGQKAQLKIVAGRGTGRIEGVALKNGKPELGVMILLVPESENALADRARRDQSDSDGTFTLQGVIPGKYILMAIENGWEIEWAKSEVLKPYRDNGQVVAIGANEVKRVSAPVQSKLN
jgi:hypothetical protein